MAVIRGLEAVPAEPRGRAVAVGIFDGVHWGHQAIFHRLVTSAAAAVLPTACLTFETHPTELLAPTRAPEYISTLDQRVELILATGIDDVIVTGFTREVAEMPREDFVGRVLIDALGAKRLVVGANFRFGKGRAGDIRYLVGEGPGMGLEVEAVPAVVIGGGPVSSTRIRAMVGRGDVDEAAKLLGRRFALRGTVVTGRKVGRKLGFPTANLSVAPRQLLPADGVYAVEVQIDHTAHPGVCNIGRRPTFGGQERSVEVHLGGFDGDIYGRTIDVGFVRRLRDEMMFDDPERLAEQIRIDLQRAVQGHTAARKRRQPAA